MFYILEPHAIDCAHYDLLCDYNRAHLNYKCTCIIQLCSGIVHGKVLNGEFYLQRFQNIIFLDLFTDCCHEDFSSNFRTNTSVFLYIWYCICSDD